MPSQQFVPKPLSIGDLLTNLGPLDGFPATPSDTVDLAPYPGQAVAGLYVGGAGTINVQYWGGATAVITAAAGAYVMGNIKRVTVGSAPPTTATGIVAIFAPI